MSQGNSLRGEAFATIDGVQYRMVLDNHTLFGIEDVLGESALDVVHTMKAAMEAGRSPMLRHASAVAYGCLYRQHPDVTEDWVIEHILDPALMAGLLQAFKGADIPDLPDDEPASAEGNAPAGKPKKKAGTGKGSSSPGAKRAATRKPSGRKPRGQ